MDDISRQRLRRRAEEIVEPLDSAIEEAALASIDYDIAFREAAQLHCEAMRAGAEAVHISVGHNSNVEVGSEPEPIEHDDVHAMAIGLTQKRIHDRTEEILREMAEDDESDDD
jgi:hypothetical protein